MVLAYFSQVRICLVPLSCDYFFTLFVKPKVVMCFKVLLSANFALLFVYALFIVVHWYPSLFCQIDRDFMPMPNNDNVKILAKFCSVTVF